MASYIGPKFFYLVKFNCINCAHLRLLQLLIKPSDNYLLTESEDIAGISQTKTLPY